MMTLAALRIIFHFQDLRFPLFFFDAGTFDFFTTDALHFDVLAVTFFRF
jgi:hypothetical protein